MYRSCIFCSAALGSNDAIERFPVGKTLAFDGAKGRLWAVCPRCSRWNLAPIGERWEAVEDAERLFRDTRLRAQSENVGLAKLRSGTRLIRVGEALPGELALWRYGKALVDRRRAAITLSVGAAALVGASVAFGSAGGVLILLKSLAYHAVNSRLDEKRTIHRVSVGAARNVAIDRRYLRTASLAPAEEGGLAVYFPDVTAKAGHTPSGRILWTRYSALITGSDALAVLRRGTPALNGLGAGRSRVQSALDLVAAHGTEGYLSRLANQREPLVNHGVGRAERQARTLAVEMALHERDERRAMEGELAALEAMWREAEMIANIADQLPDLPRPDPPRLRA
ncbi:MAG TPA: hypothetical protein VF665_21100 [Longimicrobium sp.]|jgi:hypothetical protein|uniref:hypothetical protein n=1 Tax=Longimicrobium sp. TaxID=2029185 RepID=UPI002EDAD60F